MQLKDGHRFLSLNKDDHPSKLTEGEVTDALNVRMGSSDEQHLSGIAETLQGEVELLINPDSLQVYYGESIGGAFIYPGFAEITIGNQIWMKRNWDANYPGSKVQDDDEDNADIYGRLYTWYQAMSDDFVPDGYRIPTEDDIDKLLAYLGGEMLAGGALKEVGISHWLPPNIGAVDSNAFRALPGGKFDDVFALLGQKGLFWIADEYDPPVADPLLDKDGNEYTSIIIGSQEWIIENLRTETYADGTPIPLVTDPDVWVYGVNVNKDIYGALYNWHAINNAHGIAPTGWHVPTQAEFDTLAAEIGSVMVTDLNARGFNIIEGGNRQSGDGSFDIITQTRLWSSTNMSPDIYFALAFDFSMLGGIFGNGNGASAAGYYLRHIKDSTILVDGETSIVTDIDGNTYNTICIGGQEWMAENYKAEHYNDGIAIPGISDNAEWVADIDGAVCYYNNGGGTPADAYCYYDNDEATYKEPYGALYNWLAVNDAHGLAYFERSGVQEVGWRVATKTDLETLSAYLGGDGVAGGKMKEIGTTHWDVPNLNADNSSRFTSIGAGLRVWNDGSFVSLNAENFIWLATEYDGNNAYEVGLTYADGVLYPNYNFKGNGFSVRCVRDIADIPLPTPESEVVFTDGISTWRKVVRDGAFMLDHTLTPTGFVGTEDIDWENVRSFI